MSARKLVINSNFARLNRGDLTEAIVRLRREVQVNSGYRQANTAAKYRLALAEAMAEMERRRERKPKQ